VEILANGKPREVPEGATVEALIRSLGLDPRFVIVERNGEPVERARYGDVRLAPGDRVELVRAVAGGGDRGAWRRERLARSRLYVVTDARRGRGDLEDFLEAILAAGVDLVQLREKDAEAGDLLRWAEVFREAASRHGALFLVNDRPDVALAADADGVHLGRNDLPPAVARRILGPDALIGLSCHAPEHHDLAPPEADYLTAGPIWETPTKPGRPGTGLELVRRAARTVDRPWFAIGGITPGNLAEVVAAGARRVVVVRAVTEAPDPAAAVRALLAGLPEPVARAAG
jgi:thiamine-phosphate pyrophosphorylase